MAPARSDRFGGQWQQVLDALSEKARANGSLYKVKEAKNNSERVKICYEDQQVRETLKSWIQELADKRTFSKNRDISNQYRAKGNKVYAGPNAQDAVDLYTKALFYAPKDSDEVYLSYGNRSAVFHFLGKNKECIEDVDRALDGGGKDTGRLAKLLVRKAKALVALGNLREAEKALSRARQLFPENSDAKQTKLLVEIEETQKKMLAALYPEPPEEHVAQEVVFEHLRDSFSPNPQFPGASSAVTIKKSPKKGRHVVATRDIELGEIVFFEKPFAFVCLPDPSHLHCHFCCKKTHNPLPCDNCAEGSYCSLECRDQAWSLFHQWECDVGLELAYNIGIAHLGLRVALTGLSAHKEDYSYVKNLLDHVNKLHPDDLYQYTLISTTLVIYLKSMTDMFPGSGRQSALFDFGGTILQHVAQLVSNGHALVDCRLNDDGNPFSICSEQQIRVATGIYPAASMMNHSCDPSIINSFHNAYLVVKAMKSIPKGSEVFNCYGPHYRRTPTSDRKELLMGQYFFECTCEPCSSPTDFLDKFLGSQCHKCSGTVPYSTLQCNKCQEAMALSFQQDVDRADVLIQKAKEYVKLKEHERAIEPAEEALTYLTEHFYKNNREILECKDLIARSCACKGEFKKSALLIEECVQGARELYGSVSIEIAGEILKLTDVVIQMMKRKCPDRSLYERTKTYAAEAEVILKLFYGIYHPKYRDLKSNVDVLRTICNRDIPPA